MRKLLISLVIIAFPEISNILNAGFIKPNNCMLGCQWELNHHQPATVYDCFMKPRGLIRAWHLAWSRHWGPPISRRCTQTQKCCPLVLTHKSLCAQVCIFRYIYIYIYVCVCACVCVFVLIHLCLSICFLIHSISFIFIYSFIYWSMINLAIIDWLTFWTHSQWVRQA